MADGRAFSTIDGASMRSQNSILLLNLIWKERHISRAEIARRTGLSPSTVSAIVSDLQGSGLVRNTGAGRSRGGRRPTLLGFCDDAYLIIGVEMGATHLTTALINLRGQVLADQSQTHDVRSDPKGTLELIMHLIRQCLRHENVPRGRLIGIGVGVPSPIHPQYPGLLSPLIMPEWREYNLKDILEETFDVPIFVDNDANVGALAERWWGVGCQDLVYIKLGTGIGAGYIIEGELYRGAGGTAGEIGHLAIDPTGPKCMCGLNGCLTTFIGSEALVQRAHDLLRTSDCTPTCVADIIAGTRIGSSYALIIMDEVARYLGIAVAGLLNLINPSIVVFGGELTSVGDILFEPLRTTIEARALSTSVAETRLVASDLGDKAIAIGAATNVLQAALNDPMFLPVGEEACSS